MKTNILLSIPALACLGLASCYPIDQGPRGPRTGPISQQNASEDTVSGQSQQDIQAQRDRMKRAADRKREAASQSVEKKIDQIDAINEPTPKPTVSTKREYSYAKSVPGKTGFVFSPYNNKVVDVRDIPSGTLVQDPTYPAAEKKFFRVP